MQASEERCEKRERGSPTGVTPRQPHKRPARESQRKDVHPPAQKQLPFSTPQWTEVEDGVLVEFILLTRRSQSWPAEKGSDYWNGAAKHVLSCLRSSVLRTGIHAFSCTVHVLCILGLLCGFSPWY